jgi:hypothetical protein
LGAKRTYSRHGGNVAKTLPNVAREMALSVLACAHLQHADRL